MRRLHSIMAAVGILAMLATGCSDIERTAGAETARRDPPASVSLRSSPEAWGVVEGATGAAQIQAWGFVVYAHAVDVAAGASYVAALQAAEAQAAAAEAARARAARSSSSSGGGGGGRPSVGAVGECTGFSVPDRVIWRESRGNPSAVGPRQPDGSYPVGCSQTLTSHYANDRTCGGLDWHTVEGQRECTNRLSNGGRNLDPWAATAG